MSEITLKIRVSAAEAAAAGVDQHGDVAVTLTPSSLSDGARAVLAQMLATDKPVDSRNTLRGYTICPVPAKPDAPSVAEWLEACAQRLEQQIDAAKVEHEKQVERERVEVRKWAARADEEIIRRAGSEWVVGSPYKSPDDMRELVRQRMDRAMPLVNRLNAEQAEKAEKARLASIEKQREELAAGERRAEQIKAWLANRAPEAMRKRHARGLLPEEDIVAAMRDEAYAPLVGLARYQRMTDEDVRRELDADEYHSVDYTTREAESAHDEDIELMERIESLMPGATCTLLEHAGWLTDADEKDDPEATRYAVKVAIKVGELQFTREYSADR